VHLDRLPAATPPNRFKTTFGGITSFMTAVTHEERVVLVDEAGNAVGSAVKSTIHHGDTPLHLGFSCYLFDDAGRVLLTRRALSKQTWPGVWTNSFCGHPAPRESVVDAVRRRARDELGVALAQVECVLPEFRYRARAADGMWENEICPVFCALAGGAVVAEPEEVMELVWVSWDELQSAARLEWAISPWARDQVPQLDAANLPHWARRRS
jgi:isopentenyl-diphosphate delta-isomerase